jgi:FkbM family methyltransferase
MNKGKSPIDSVCADWDEHKVAEARCLCRAFLHTAPSKRFILGRNVYSDAVAQVMEVAGIVDDYCDAESANGHKIFRMDGLPKDAFVLAAAGGRPLTVRQKLADRGLRQLDYFSFYKWSGLDLPQAVFNEDFNVCFEANRDQVDWLYHQLADQESRDTLLHLLRFRASYDIDFLSDFSDKQKEQYFEDFLDLKNSVPVFFDVGGFDGETTAGFVNRVPDYRAAYVFEPEPGNAERCRERLAGLSNVSILPFGASERSASLRFSTNGSASHLCEVGELHVEVRRLDEFIDFVPTFMKMDIEGAELSALQGASEIISVHRPTMAICVYHRPSHFWEIPKKILSIRSDYRVYIRHYTESIYETVMYFVPSSRP